MPVRARATPTKTESRGRSSWISQAARPTKTTCMLPSTVARPAPIHWMARCQNTRSRPKTTPLASASAEQSRRQPPSAEPQPEEEQRRQGVEGAEEGRRVGRDFGQANEDRREGDQEDAEEEGEVGHAGRGSSSLRLETELLGGLAGAGRGRTGETATRARPRPAAPSGGPRLRAHAPAPARRRDGRGSLRFTASSVSDGRLISTLSAAPSAAARAQAPATPASETEAGLPRSAAVLASSSASSGALEHAQRDAGRPLVGLLDGGEAGGLAPPRSSSAAGRRAITALNASVSASTAWMNQSLSAWPRRPVSCIAARASSMPFFDQVSAATMADSAADSEPHSAATLPPPGAGESLRQLVGEVDQAHRLEARRRAAVLVLDDLLRRVERGQLVEPQRQDGGVDPLLLGHAGRRALARQVVVAGGEDRLERHQADQLAAGDAHAELRGLLAAGVEHLVQRGDVVVHQVERDLGAAVLLDVPAAALQLREAARQRAAPCRSASRTNLPFASRLSLPVSRSSAAISLASLRSRVLRLTFQAIRNSRAPMAVAPLRGVELGRAEVRRELRVLQLLGQRLVLALADVRQPLALRPGGRIAVEVDRDPQLLADPLAEPLRRARRSPPSSRPASGTNGQTSVAPIRGVLALVVATCRSAPPPCGWRGRPPPRPPPAGRRR